MKRIHQTQPKKDKTVIKVEIDITSLPSNLHKYGALRNKAQVFDDRRKTRRRGNRARAQIQQNTEENTMAETFTFKTNRKLIERALLVDGFTKKVECKNYWDSHGTRFDRADTQLKFDCEKKFEIYKEVYEYYFDFVPTQTWEFWNLYIDGQKVEDLGEITSYHALKTKLKLDCCVGAG